MSGPDHFYIIKEEDLAQVVQAGYSLEFITGIYIQIKKRGCSMFIDG